MACIRKRRGKWVVDYRDSAGVRRWATCKTRREAEAILAEKVRESRQATRPVVDPDITLAAYAERWLGLIAASVKPRTLDTARYVLERHLLPALGSAKVRQLGKGQVKAFLAGKLASGLAPASVRIIYSTLRALLNAAGDDGMILANPAARLGRQLRLVQPPAVRQEEIKAMTREQLAAFLKVSDQDRRYAPFFLLLARTGMRLGEALALQWDDVHFQAREIRVARALSAGRIETPKSGHGRTVDMSRELAAALRRHQVEQKAETLKRGWREMPPWVFCTEAATPLDKSKVRKVFARVLKRGGLPLHFSPHCLRHTFASLLLQAGASPVYIQRQLGHSSIKLTVDTYGRWLPVGDKSLVDRLDDESGSKVVAKTMGAPKDAQQVPNKSGEPWWDRTTDPLLKRQVLYLLS